MRFLNSVNTQGFARVRWCVRRRRTLPWHRGQTKRVARHGRHHMEKPFGAVQFVANVFKHDLIQLCKETSVHDMREKYVVRYGNFFDCSNFVYRAD